MTPTPSSSRLGLRAAPAPLRVVVADDFHAMLQRLQDFVASFSNMTVVATATNGRDAWDAIVRLKPDVALLDFQMPGLSGLDIAVRVRSGELSTRVLIISVYEGPEVRSRCLAAGADGFIAKHRLSTELPIELDRLVKAKPAPGQSQP